jgi:hypothetical protein
MFRYISSRINSFCVNSSLEESLINKDFNSIYINKDLKVTLLKILILLKFKKEILTRWQS